MGVSHQDRLAAIVAAPSRLDLGSTRDAKLLTLATAPDLATLRTTAAAGSTAVQTANGASAADPAPVADRVVAVLALVWLGDPAAGDLLAALLADPECEQTTMSKLAYLGNAPEASKTPGASGASRAPGASEAIDGHRGLVEPWLIERLGAPEEPLTRSAGWACGRLRVAGAGPRLLELARESSRVAYLAEWPWDTGRYLAQAARCWPGQEVLDEVRRRAEAEPDGEPSFTDVALRPTDAAAELAASGPPGVYEWALDYCATVLRTGAQQHSMLEALEIHAPESIPMLEEIVRTAPGSAGPGMALEVLARVAPELADRCAREHWRRFTSSALEVLGQLYRGSGDPGVAALVGVIAAERPLEGMRCADALLDLGGDDALAEAVRLMASLPSWMQGRRDVERRLERRLARAAR